jgi:hypothetical protein
MWTRVGAVRVGIIGTRLSRGSRLRNRIVSATAEWIAAQNTPDGHSATRKDTVPRYGLVAIFRATRDEAAGGWQQWREHLPVERDTQERQPRHRARRALWQQRRRAIVDRRMLMVVCWTGKAQSSCPPSCAGTRRPARRNILASSCRASSEPGSSSTVPRMMITRS